MEISFCWCYVSQQQKQKKRGRIAPLISSQFSISIPLKTLENQNFLFHSFFDGPGPLPSIILHPFLVNPAFYKQKTRHIPPSLQQNIFCKAPYQNHNLYFSFNLLFIQLKSEKELFFDIFILSSVMFFTLFIINKVLIK